MDKILDVSSNRINRKWSTMDAWAMLVIGFCLGFMIGGML